MQDYLEGALLSTACALLVAAFLRTLRPYRPLLIGGGALMLLTALYPRPGNRLGIYIFGAFDNPEGLSNEVLGVVWWILGAWLFSNMLALILRRTLFPNDNQPHARRLFADLASGLVYVVAVVGIIDTVLKQPVATVLATSGVLAIVLGLALQNTLADVFAGLAINIERPFGAGDWITVNTLAEGQVIEINWRATRIKTTSNDIIVVPNSVIAKAVVTNHRRVSDPLWRSVAFSVDHSVLPARVVDALRSPSLEVAGLAAGTVPSVYARGLIDSLVQYELCFAIEDFAGALLIQSEMLKQLLIVLYHAQIPIGAAPTEVRVLKTSQAAANGPEVASMPPG